MRPLLFVLLLAAVSTAPLYAQEHQWSTGVRFHLSGRSDKAVFYAPESDSLSVFVTPQNLRRHVVITRIGSYGGRPLVRAQLRTSAQVTVEVRWTVPLQQSDAMYPPFGERLVNPNMAPAATRRSKSSNTERAQENVEARQWYTPDQPHARVETYEDGIAIVTGDNVGSAVPALLNVPLAELRMFRRGVEIPIYVIDSDNSGTFTRSDTVVFVGSHPRGDTAFLDVQDTTAIHFLTRRSGSEPMRYSEVSAQPGTKPALTGVTVHRRFELDTGYYHPGSNNNEDYSTFLTPLALYEGFYWSVLNGRAGNYATQTFSFAPSGEGDVEVTADVVTSTDAERHNPDHFVHVSLNGSDPLARIGNGFARYSIPIRVPGSTMPAFGHQLRLFAKGTPDVLQTSDWFSEVLLDGITVRGSAAMMLFEGKLEGGVQSRPDYHLIVDNGSSAPSFAIDTTQRELRRLTPIASVVTVMAGLFPEAIADPYKGPETSTYTATVRFDDAVAVSLPLSNRYAQVRRRINSDEALVSGNRTAEQIVTALQTLPSDDILVVFSKGNIPTPQLIAEFARFGVTLTESDTMFIAAVQGNRGKLSTAGPEPTRGLVWSAEDNRSTVRKLSGGDIPGNKVRHFVIGSGYGIERASVSRASLEHLAQDQTQATVIVITARELRPAAERWAKYRSTASSVTIRIVDVESIFDEFDAGRHSPEALRAYLAHAWESAPLPKPTHCVLFGNASWDVRLAIKGGNARSSRADLVPTFGKPSSDYWFGLLDDPLDLATPELIVSRFPVLTTAEANAMIDKIIEADTVQVQPWHRTFLYAGGGETEDEGLCQIYEDLLSDKYETGVYYTEPTLCLDTVTVCKAKSDAPGLEIRRAVNSGVGMMNYIGHGGTEVFDIRGWNPEDLANSGRYPVMATFSCLTGAFSNSSAPCKNAQYLVQPKQGMVAAIGATGWQYKVVISQIHIDIHEALRKTTIRDLGRLTYAGTRSMATMSQQFALNSAYQFAILGDPFTRIRIDTTVQLSVVEDRVTVAASSGNTQITEDDDSAHVTVEVWSEGIGTRVPYDVVLRRTYNGNTDSVRHVVTNGVCLQNLIHFSLDVNGKPGAHFIEIEVDPSGRLRDRRSDNIVRLTMTVFSKALLVVEPDSYGAVTPGALHVRMLDVLSSAETQYNVHAVLANGPDTSAAMLRALPSEFRRDGVIVDWRSQRMFSADISQPWIGVWAEDEKTGFRTSITWIPIAIRVGSIAPSQHDVQYGHLRIADTTLTYDAATGTVRVKSYQLPVFVQSSGILTSNPDRDPLLLIQIGNETILRNSFRTGINIVVLGRRDSVPVAIRRYDTSADPLPIETGHYGFARECITYLRDSIRSTDRVIIAACNESFARFVSDGLIDTLRAQLRVFGAQLADSLTLASSYAFVGGANYGTDGIAESWKGAPQFMVTALDTCVFHYPGGSASSPAIGPARRWKSSSVDASANVQSTLYGVSSAGTPPVVLGTELQWTPTGADTSIPTVFYQWNVTGTEEQPEAYVRSVDAQYEPLPQWLLENNALQFAQTTVARGDTAQGILTIRNARTLWSAPPTQVITTVRNSAGGEVSRQNIQIGVIASDAKSITPIDIPTASLPPVATVQTTIGVVDPELYRVRDRATARLTIGADQEPPTIDIIIDGRYLPAGGTVYREPQFDIRMRDNSPLPITDPTKLIVFVNGTRIRADNTTGFRFIPTAEAEALWPGQNVRAALQFVFPLELGDNLLIVRATDAGDNSDTVEVPLITTTDVVVQETQVVPNPTEGAVTFVVDHVATTPTSAVRIDVYDTQGRRVRSLSGVIPVGRAYVSWDGFGDAGQMLPVGPYWWRISVENSQGTEASAATGGLIILR